MKQRVLTSWVFVPIILLLVYWGGVPLYAGMALLTLVGVQEFGSMLRNRRVQWNMYLNIIAALIFLTLVSWRMDSILIWAILVYIIILFSWGWRNFVHYPEIIFTILGVLYISCGFGLITTIGIHYDSWHYLLLVILNVWITDTGAFLIGSKIGKHKLAPRISPKKTIEGLLGGTICAVIITGIFAAKFLNLEIGYALILVAIISLLGHVGDLLESVVKRWAGVKDSGKFFPGHGGVLDRFDSLLLAAPAAWVLYNIFEVLERLV